MVYNSNFIELDNSEAMQVEGGLITLFCGAIVITKGAAIAMGIFTTGAIVGGIVAYNTK